MDQNNKQQREHLPNKVTPKVSQVSHHNSQPIPSSDRSDFEPKLDHSSSTSLKTSTSAPESLHNVLPSFDTPRHYDPSGAPSGQNEHRSQSDYHTLDRPWTYTSPGKLSHTSGTAAPDQNPTVTPMSRWESEAPIDGPYHAIGKVAKKQATHSSQKPSDASAVHRPASSVAGTWGSMCGRRE